MNKTFGFTLVEVLIIFAIIGIIIAIAMSHSSCSSVEYRKEYNQNNKWLTSTITRTVDPEFNVVCYEASGNGKGISCLSLNKENK